MGAHRRPGRKPGKLAGALAHGEFVRYPGGPAAVYDVLERLAAVAGDSPDFGSPGISLDRTRLTVRWFGELPPDVQRVVDGAGEGVTVVVEHPEFRPGDLRAEAARLTRDHADVVAVAIARPEGDGIDVLVPPAVAEAAGGPEQALTGVSCDFPLVVVVGEVPQG